MFERDGNYTGRPWERLAEDPDDAPIAGAPANEETGTHEAPRDRAIMRARTAGRALVPSSDRTERRMVLVQWCIMPLVLAGCIVPPPRPHEPSTNAAIAAMVMAVHPLLYLLLGRFSQSRNSQRSAWYDGLLTATDVTVATLVFYATVARPGYAQVLLYCAVALAATRYPLRRAVGITSLVALLLLFAVLLPLQAAVPTVISEIIGLYALTYLVGLLSQAEKAVTYAAEENARLAQTVLQRNRELSALNTLARTLNAQTDERAIFTHGIAGMASALNLSLARAYLIDDGRPVLVARTESVENASEAVERRRQHEVDRAIAAGRAVIKGWHIPDAATGRIVPGPLTVSTPLRLRGEIAAVIQVEFATAAHGAEETIKALDVFCGELAVAHENIILRGEASRTAILQEKNRIAQELHDTVLQMLFSIGLRLQWCLDRLPGGHDLCDPLMEARRLSANAGSELRSAIFTLGSDIAEVGLVAAVQRLVDEQAARAGWSANVITSGDVAPMAVVLQNAAHRVVREALMNAYKHAHASEVMVSLRFGPNLLSIVVQDNGTGLSDDALQTYRQTPDHFGLRTVAAQVEDLGGEFTVYNNDERGATVKAQIPLAAATTQAA